MTQAANLNSLMDQAGVIKNSIIPKDQSLATSRFYGALANRARGPSRPGVSLIPFHTNIVAHVPSHPFPGPPGPQLSNGFGDNYFSSHGININGGIPHNFYGNTHGPPIPYMVGNQRGFLVPHHPGLYNHLPPNGEVVIHGPAPVAQQSPFVPSSMPPPPIPSRVGTARGKTAEEARKVRDYGFPPLPSSRPGMQLAHNISPAKRKFEDFVVESS